MPLSRTTTLQMNRAASFPSRRVHHEPLHHRHSLTELSSDREAIETMLTERFSAPQLSRMSLNPKETPESVLMCATVQFSGASRRENHCVYAMQVSSGYETHVLHKRYSEFRQFRGSLLRVLDDSKTHCTTGGPCSQLMQLSQVKFPRRRLKMLRREGDLDVARERAFILERFMQALLRVYHSSSRRHMRRCVNADCAVANLIKRFLQVVECSQPTPDAMARGPAEGLEFKCPPNEDGNGNEDLIASGLTEEAEIARVAAATLPMPRGFPQVVGEPLRAAKPVWLFPIHEERESIHTAE